MVVIKNEVISKLINLTVQLPQLEEIGSFRGMSKFCRFVSFSEEEHFQ